MWEYAHVLYQGQAFDCWSWRREGGCMNMSAKCWAGAVNRGDGAGEPLVALPAFTAPERGLREASSSQRVLKEG